MKKKWLQTLTNMHILVESGGHTRLYLDPIMKNITSKLKPIFTRYFWANLGVLLVALTILITLFVVKADRSGLGNGLLLVYTMLITIFQLFRLVLALLSDKVLASVESVDPQGVYEPYVSIVVPCMNEEDAIGHTLLQCFAAHYPKDKLEVIVINDGSTDDTAREIEKVKVRHPELTVITFEKNKGKREGMVAGFRVAKGEVVVQLDSDSYIDPIGFRHLITPFANPMIGAVCAHADVQNASQNVITKMQAGYYFIAFRVLKAAESALLSVFCCSGCSSAYRKDLVMPILDKFLNERFMGVKVKHGDDRSLTGWVLKSGHKAVYTHKVQAYTIAPHTVKQLFKQQARWKKSWISNGFFTFKYIFKTDLFVGLFYYLPLILISFLTPLVAFYNVYLLSILHLTFPVVYLTGGLLITLLYMLYAFRLSEGEKKYIGYFLVWQFLTVTIFSYILYYSFFRFRDQRWGTR